MTILLATWKADTAAGKCSARRKHDLRIKLRPARALKYISTRYTELFAALCMRSTVPSGWLVHARIYIYSNTCNSFCTKLYGDRSRATHHVAFAGLGFPSVAPLHDATPYVFAGGASVSLSEIEISCGGASVSLSSGAQKSNFPVRGASATFGPESPETCRDSRSNVRDWCWGSSSLASSALVSCCWRPSLCNAATRGCVRDAMCPCLHAVLRELWRAVCTRGFKIRS